jgi:hypothetical protein
VGLSVLDQLLGVVPGAAARSHRDRGEETDDRGGATIGIREARITSFWAARVTMEIVLT